MNVDGTRRRDTRSGVGRGVGSSGSGGDAVVRGGVVVGRV